MDLVSQIVDIALHVDVHLGALIAAMGPWIYGILLWVFLVVGSGYFFGNMPLVQSHFSLVIMAIVLLSVVPASIEFLRERLVPAAAEAEKSSDSPSPRFWSGALPDVFRARRLSLEFHKVSGYDGVGSAAGSAAF